MRRRIFARLLLAEAVVCLAVWALQWNVGGGVASLMSFPFAPLGQGLRWLSLSGGAGNVLAILLYIILSLLPLGVLLLLKRRQMLPELNVLICGQGRIFIPPDVFIQII